VCQRDLFKISNEEESSSSIFTIAQRFNQISFWVMALILGELTETARVEIIQKASFGLHACLVATMLPPSESQSLSFRL
jgi:hypothetical protein